MIKMKNISFIIKINTKNCFPLFVSCNVSLLISIYAQRQSRVECSIQSEKKNKSRDFQLTSITACPPISDYTLN